MTIKTDEFFINIFVGGVIVLVVATVINAQLQKRVPELYALNTNAAVS